MLTDLIKIRENSLLNEDEDFRFRRYVKDHDYSEKKFRELARHVTRQIDCRQCANCCRVFDIEITDKDVAKLASHLGISDEDLRENYTIKDAEGQTILRRDGNGCLFLKGNDGSVYPARPKVCSAFPHLVEGDGPISTRMWSFIDRAGTCPIAYNSLERFKDMLRFRRSSRVS